MGRRVNYYTQQDNHNQNHSQTFQKTLIKTILVFNYICTRKISPSLILPKGKEV